VFELFQSFRRHLGGGPCRRCPRHSNRVSMRRKMAIIWSVCVATARQWGTAPGRHRMGNGDLTSITFVHAPDAFLAETQQYGAMFMPVWAYTLAAYINEPERYNLTLCDLRFDNTATIAE